MIKAEDISLTIAGRLLLDRVSVTIKPSCFTVLLGNNGAGKSTLLSVLSGERKPTKGRISYDQKPLQTWSAIELARQRAVMLQTTRLDFSMSVADVVALGRLPFSGTSEAQHDKLAIAHARRAAQLDQLWWQPYPTLSGGEGQRVHFARSLAQVWSPISRAPARFLFLDEPTSAMDLRQRRLLLEAARELTLSGTGIVAVLHDLNLALHYADDIVLLREGRVQAQGPVEAVMTAAQLSTCFETQVDIMTREEGPSFILA